MNLTLMLVLSALAGARTFRLLAVDCIGRPIRWRFDSLVWSINPKSFRGMMKPKRKHVSKLTWRRHRIAKSLAEGYSCRWCFGYWYTAAWVATGLAWSDTWVWQLLAGSLAASYVVGLLGLFGTEDVPCEDDD